MGENAQGQHEGKPFNEDEWEEAKDVVFVREEDGRRLDVKLFRPKPQPPRELTVTVYTKPQPRRERTVIVHSEPDRDTPTA